MRLIEYYFRLFLTFAKLETDLAIQVTRHAISDVLFCSERNVIHILKKLDKRGWISVISGRGRGNKTAITFHRTAEEMFHLVELNSPKTEDIERLIKLLEESHTAVNGKQLIQVLVIKLFGIRDDLPQTNSDEREHLNIPYYRSILSLDPAYVERQTERHLAKHLFSTLITYNEHTGELEPGLAYYWDLDPKGKSATFYLRKGVLFHSAQELTSEDVCYSFERLAYTPAKWIIHNIAKIECLGKYIIQFHFKRPVYHWLQLLTSVKCSIIPRRYGGLTQEAFAKLPIGTGPYMLTEHEPNFLKLCVHQHYFRERAYIDDISIFILPTIDKYLDSQFNHEALFYIPFTLSNRESTRYQTIERHDLSVKYLIWNMNKAHLKHNLPLRRKLTAIVNREKLIQTNGYPRFRPAYTFMRNNIAKCQEAHGQSMDTKELLKSEAVDIGSIYNQTLTMISYDLPPHLEDMRMIQKVCKEHGITVNIEIYPYATFLNKVRDADLVYSEYVSEDIEEASLFNLFASETSVFASLLDPHLQAIAEQYLTHAVEQADYAKRAEILAKLDHHFIEESITVPLYWTYQKALFNPYLMGLSLNTLGLVPFEKLFFRKRVETVK